RPSVDRGNQRQLMGRKPSSENSGWLKVDLRSSSNAIGAVGQSAYLLFARSLGHRAGAVAAPFGSAFRTRVPRPPGFGLLPPRRLRVPFQKLLLLATRPCRDLEAAHLCARRDVSRLTGQSRGRDTDFSVPPAQIRTGGFPASGSYLR